MIIINVSDVIKDLKNEFVQLNPVSLPYVFMKIVLGLHFYQDTLPNISKIVK